MKARVVFNYLISFDGILHSRRSFDAVSIQNVYGPHHRSQISIAISEGHIVFLISGIDAHLRRNRRQTIHYLLFGEIRRLSIYPDPVFPQHVYGVRMQKTHPHSAEYLQRSFMDSLSFCIISRHNRPPFSPVSPLKLLIPLMIPFLPQRV